MSDATSLRMGPGRHTRSPSAACLAAQVAKPFLVSVCPVASDTRTPVGTRITCLARPAPLRQWPQIASQYRPTCDPKRSPLSNSISAMPGGAAKSATTATGAWSTSPAGAPLRWQFRRLAWAKMRQVRMNVVPASDFGHGYQQPGSPQQSAASPPRSNPAAASDLARQSLSLMCPVTCK